MNITLDQEAIAAAINASATAAIKQSLGGYELQKSLAQVITDQVATGAIAAAVRRAVQEVDHQGLTRVLAAELQRATVCAVVEILHEGLVDIVCKLRGITAYGDSDNTKRARVSATLRIDLAKVSKAESTGEKE